MAISPNAFCHQVLEFCGDTDNYFYTYFVKNRIGGTDFTLRFARCVFATRKSHQLPFSSFVHQPPLHFSVLVLLNSIRNSGYYEPAFRFSAAIERASDMEASHRLWVEDQFVNPPAAFSASRWTLVGVLASPEAGGAANASS